MYFKNSNEFIENGVHIGHRKSSLNVNMKENVLTNNSVINLINVNKTMECLKRVEKFLSTMDKIEPIFVFLKNSTKIVADFVYDNGFSVMKHWPNGFLTNYDVVSANVEEFSLLKGNERFKNIKEKRRLNKLDRYFGKVNISSKPNILVLSDQLYCADIIREANKVDIPTICIIDSNTNPNLVTLPVFGNDDIESSVKFLMSKIILLFKIKNQGEVLETKEEE